MKAYELLADPNNWTQCGYAYANSDDKPVGSDDSQICKYCIYGALRTVYGPSTTGQAILAINKKLFPDFDQPESAKRIFIYNDSPTTTHEDVCNLLRELDL